MPASRLIPTLVFFCAKGLMSFRCIPSCHCTRTPSTSHTSFPDSPYQIRWHIPRRSFTSISQRSARCRIALQRSCKVHTQKRCLCCRAEAGATSSTIDPVAQTITAFAPATIANLGPGFDWLGCAVEVRQLLPISETIPHIMWISYWPCRVAPEQFLQTHVCG